MGIAFQPTFLNQRIYSTFDKGKTGRSLPELCLELLSEQKKAWKDLREGFELLKNVREREIPCRGFSVRLQYNPGRIKSSTANVSKKDRAGQSCFLCLGHLPEEQKGILYRNKYLILCNPMPVFSSHFTVSHVDHRHQAIDGNIDTLLQLTADFGSDWTVLYNGPKCGASAPDHHHFQAASSGQMPIEKELRTQKNLIVANHIDGVLLCHVRDPGREIVILEGEDSMAVKDALTSFVSALKTVLLTEEEPMLNIAGFHEEGKWRLVIFPRRKHRPDAFFKEGEARVVVSPGVIDMGGLLITPVERDFYRLDAAAVESIYKEVSLEGTIVERAIKTLGIME